MFGVEISKQLGGYGLFFLVLLGGGGDCLRFFFLFLSPSRKPIHIALVACKRGALSSLALVMYFLNFKKPSLQKLLFLVGVVFSFVCFQTTQQLLQNIMNLGCAFHKAASKKSSKEAKFQFLMYFLNGTA